ncbi:MAG: hypothetical protein VR70_09945 [Rhodospirillaceae bacterium BRH_c57]|nr:MAG: hypothetical protein VR70_09945 [Rhodospirillaceae bacterium BRH_c57]
MSQISHIDPAAADALRSYLDHSGFSGIYKFIVGANLYTVLPSVINTSSVGQVTGFFDEVLGDDPDVTLLRCLIAGETVERERLDGRQSELADGLIEGGILQGRDGRIGPTTFQLISAFGRDLLIDRRINFGGGIHEIYIGFDSYAMVHHIQQSRLLRGGRAVDLCCGSGIAALYMSQFCDSVVGTDIGEAPLALSRFNRRLNGCDDRVEIREQRLEATLEGPERFDVLTCNPPFVAYPPGLNGTLYSKGPDIDGQGYVRQIIEALPRVLNPGGAAYLVTDLVGDAARPHFMAELDVYARKLGLQIDVYVDNRIEAEVQVEPMAGYLHGLNPEISVEDLRRRFRAFQADDLRASHYHMSTIRLVTDAPAPRLRMLRRFPVPHTPAEPKWPPILEFA